MRFHLIIATILPLLPLLQGCTPILDANEATDTIAPNGVRMLMSDEIIENKAASAIDLDADLKKLVHVQVTSLDGSVLLTGEAATPEARDRVLSHVRSINGVLRIRFKLREAPPCTLDSRKRDSLITGAIKSYLATQRFNPTPPRIKVVTESGVVYLMGQVTHAVGDLATAHAATIEGVTGVVKVFQYID